MRTPSPKLSPQIYSRYSMSHIHISRQKLYLYIDQETSLFNCKLICTICTSWLLFVAPFETVFFLLLKYFLYPSITARMEWMDKITLAKEYCLYWTKNIWSSVREKQTMISLKRLIFQNEQDQTYSFRKLSWNFQTCIVFITNYYEGGKKFKFNSVILCPECRMDSIEWKKSEKIMTEIAVMGYFQFF